MSKSAQASSTARQDHNDDIPCTDEEQIIKLLRELADVYMLAKQSKLQSHAMLMTSTHLSDAQAIQVTHALSRLHNNLNHRATRMPVIDMSQTQTESVHSMAMLFKHMIDNNNHSAQFRGSLKDALTSANHLTMHALHQLHPTGASRVQICKKLDAVSSETQLLLSTRRFSNGCRVFEYPPDALIYLAVRTALLTCQIDFDYYDPVKTEVERRTQATISAGQQMAEAAGMTLEMAGVLAAGIAGILHQAVGLADTEDAVNSSGGLLAALQPFAFMLLETMQTCGHGEGDGTSAKGLGVGLRMLMECLAVDAFVLPLMSGCFGIPLGTVADKVWGTYPAGKLIDHLYEWPAVIEDVRAPVHVNDPLDQSLSGWEALTITIKWARQKLTVESDELEFLQKLLLNTMQKCTEYQAAYHPILDHVDIMVKMITPAALFHCGATRKAHPMYISRAVGQLCCSTLPQGGPPTVPDLTTEQAMQVVYHFCTLACYGSFGGQDDTLGFESMAEMVLALYPALVAVVSNPDLLYSLHHTLLARFLRTVLRELFSAGFGCLSHTQCVDDHPPYMCDGGRVIAGMMVDLLQRMFEARTSDALPAWEPDASGRVHGIIYHTTPTHKQLLPHTASLWRALLRDSQDVLQKLCRLQNTHPLKVPGKASLVHVQPLSVDNSNCIKITQKATAKLDDLAWISWAVDAAFCSITRRYMHDEKLGVFYAGPGRTRPSLAVNLDRHDALRVRLVLRNLAMQTASNGKVYEGAGGSSWLAAVPTPLMTFGARAAFVSNPEGMYDMPLVMFPVLPLARKEGGVMQFC